jgi:uncharacterized membrane protein
MVWDIAVGAAFVACGLTLVVLFGRAERSGTHGAAVFAVGIIAMLLGGAAVALALRDPFSWMMAIVGLAIFIDALCLKLRLRIVETPRP